MVRANASGMLHGSGGHCQERGIIMALMKEKSVLKKWFYQDSLSFGFKRRLYRSRLMEA
jgi:hypothetical protein